MPWSPDPIRSIRPPSPRAQRGRVRPLREFRRRSLPERLLPVVVALVPIVWGCDPGQGQATGVTSWDSAGITIVESTAPAASQTWSVDPDPVLVIGVAEGDEPYLLSRVGDARLRPDGGVILLDGASRQVRVYSPDGTFRQAAGGPGDGPGEFRQLPGPLVIEEDGGVLVWDSQLRRLTRLGPDLALRETLVPEAVNESRGMGLLGRFRDGALLLSEQRPLTPSSQGPFTDTLRLHRADARGRHLNPLARLPHGEGTVQSMGASGAMQAVVISLHPLGATGHAVPGSALVLAGGGAFEVRATEPDGTPTWIARPGRSRRPLDASARAELIGVLAAGTSNPDAARARYEAMSWPSHLPALDRLVLDDEGNAWVREYRAPFDEGDARWQVIDPAGAWLAEVFLPGDLQVTHITADRVLGIHRDDLDVESVRLHHLRR